jgi:hypothetical protein
MLSERKRSRRQTNAISPFALYLIQPDVKAQLKDNIDHIILPGLKEIKPEDNENFYGYFSRYFSNLANVADYSGFKSLRDCINKKGPINELAVVTYNKNFSNWMDFALLKAFDDLFDANGNIKKDVFDALNYGHALEKISESCQLNNAKRLLVASYILLLGETVAPDLDNICTKVDMDNPHPERQHNVTFGQAMNELSMSINQINKFTIESHRKKVAEAMDKPDYEPKRLKPSFQHRTYAAESPVTPTFTNDVQTGLGWVGGFFAWVGGSLWSGVKSLLCCCTGSDNENDGYPLAVIKPGSKPLNHQNIHASLGERVSAPPSPQRQASRNNRQQSPVVEDKDKSSLTLWSCLFGEAKAPDKASDPDAKLVTGSSYKSSLKRS